MEKRKLLMPVTYSRYITFIPQHIHVVIEISDALKRVDTTRTIRFDAELVSERCEDSYMVIPDTLKEPGDENVINY